MSWLLQAVAIMAALALIWYATALSCLAKGPVEVDIIDKADYAGRNYYQVLWPGQYKI